MCLTHGRESANRGSLGHVRAKSPMMGIIGEDTLAEGVGVILERVAHGDGSETTTNHAGPGCTRLVLAVVIVERDEEGAARASSLRRSPRTLGDRAPLGKTLAMERHVSASLGNLEAGASARRGTRVLASWQVGLLQPRGDDARRAQDTPRRSPRRDTPGSCTRRRPRGSLRGRPHRQNQRACRCAATPSMHTTPTFRRYDSPSWPRSPLRDDSTSTRRPSFHGSRRGRGE